MKDSLEFCSRRISDLSVSEVYKLFIHCVIPRPIAFVSTRSAAGVGNLAPFSFFTVVSSDPAVLCFSVAARSDGGKKDTLRNIEETGQFVVNSSNEWMIDSIAGAAADYPFGVDELDKVGLTAIPSTLVRPMRVQESIVQFECELFQSIAIGNGGPGSATLVLGQVLMLHVRADALEGTKVDSSVHRPVARLGGISYSTLGEILERPIPKLS